MCRRRGRLARVLRWVHARPMDIGQTYRPLGTVNISALLAKIGETDAATWEGGEYVRQHLAGPRPTKSIFVCSIISPNIPTDRRLRQSDVKRLDGDAAFGPLLQPIMDQLLAHYPPDGVVVRCQITNLLAGKEIERHSDIGPLLKNSHRIHVPLITSSDVKFFVEGAEIPCVPGEAFELNNQRPHWVVNASPDDRIHFLFDYLPADYDMEAVRWKKKR